MKNLVVDIEKVMREAGDKPKWAIIILAEGYADLLRRVESIENEHTSMNEMIDRLAEKNGIKKVSQQQGNAPVGHDSGGLSIG